MSTTTIHAPRALDLPDGTTLIALHDGVFRAEASVLHDQAGADETAALVASWDGGVVVDVNAFALLRPHEGVVLIDAGAGDSWGPDLGHAARALETHGIAAGDVVAVLLTHLHGDHALGLFDASGAWRYRNAEIWCSRIDHDLYGSAEKRDTAAEAARGSFDIARRVLDAAGPRLRLFDAGDVVLPGIEAVPLPGHTPGHSGFLVGSLTLVTGDVFQVAALQGTRPSVGLVYDADPATAERTRRECLETGAARSWVVVGSHMPFPGVVTIGETEDGYRFEPLDAG